MGEEIAKTKVLFLCSANSARSQMAEAFLKRLGGECFEVHSAGLVPGPAIHPLAVQVMNEVGLDLKDASPKQLKQFFGKLHPDFVIFVCERAEENCPFLWPMARLALSWPFENPAAIEGPLDDQLAKFRQVRDQIERKIQDWLAKEGWVQ